MTHLRAWPRVCLVLYYSVGLCITPSGLHAFQPANSPASFYYTPPAPKEKAGVGLPAAGAPPAAADKMPEEADPYAFNAPQYADLASEAKAGGAMSPATCAWFGAPSPLAPCPFPYPAPCVSCALLSTQMTSRARTEVVDQCRMSRRRRRRRLRSSRSSRCPRPPPPRRLHPRPGRLAHLPARTNRR